MRHPTRKHIADTWDENTLHRYLKTAQNTVEAIEDQIAEVWLKQTVDKLPYKVGDVVEYYFGRDGYEWVEVEITKFWIYSFKSPNVAVKFRPLDKRVSYCMGDKSTYIKHSYIRLKEKI